MNKIYFTPKPNTGLTFVLSHRLEYIHESFWQPGNYYVLNVLDDNGTFDYLQREKDNLGIEISEQDEFGYWHISKKKK